MTRIARLETGSEVAQLREALAASELQLREARAELGRLVRITERSLAEQRAEAEAAISEKAEIEARMEMFRASTYALINLMRDSDLLPKEVIMSWLVQSDIFDPEHYLRENGDVADANLDPAEHFFECGIDERRGFNAAFPERA
jgi:hypothetical protein